MRAAAALAVTLLVATAAVAVCQPSSCPPFTPYYMLLVEIHRRTAIAVLRLHPQDVNWTDFYAACYSPDPDYWHELLEGIVVEALRLPEGAYSVVAEGADNSTEAVFVMIEFPLEASGLYDDYSDSVGVLDPLLPDSCLNNVTIRADRAIFHAEPEPSERDDNYVMWLSSSPSEAPKAYRAYFRVPVTIAVEGLPPHIVVWVYVNGTPTLTIKGGEKAELYLLPGDVVALDRNIESDDARYVLVTPPLVVREPTFAVFEYRTEFRVTITSNAPGAWAIIDGKKVALPFQDWWISGEKHDVEVPETIPVTSTPTQRTSYSFVRWSDGVTKPKRVLVAKSPLEVEVVYREITEYLVVAYSDYGKVYGEGWYVAGSTAKVGIKGCEHVPGSCVISVGRGERKVFLGWTGDVTSTSPEVRFTVDGPKTLRAKWKTQYYVYVYTPYSEAVGSGWYDAGSTAIVYVKSTFVQRGNIGYRFVGWYEGGIIVTVSARAVLRVDRPRELRAKWVEVVRVAVRDEAGESVIEPLGAASGWVDKGTEIRVKVKPKVVYGFPANMVACALKVGNRVYKLDEAITADRPLVIVVVRCADYTPAGTVAAVCGGAIAAYAYFRFRRQRPAETVPVEMEVEEETKVYEEEEESTRVYGEGE